jgi:hypothetical protein
MDFLLPDGAARQEAAASSPSVTIAVKTKYLTFVAGAS